ncbi:Myb-related protein [Quillaja saponaria]|uniref:Myb-related protein n=1 Tax=Quillaja saponaria TaxID=32244 RepID=A0AAD7PZ34_QUISA|nr:Myb-related protein [Quillaja saponaria]
MKDSEELWHQKTQATKMNECSTESCLTSCEESRKNHDMYESCIVLRTHNGTPIFDLKEIVEVPTLQNSDLKLCNDLKENMNFLSSSAKDEGKIIFSPESSSSNISMNIRHQGEIENGGEIYPQGKCSGRNLHRYFQNQGDNRKVSIKYASSLTKAQ